MYALFEKVDDEDVRGKKRLQITRFQVPPDVSEHKTSLRRPFPVLDPDEPVELKQETPLDHIDPDNSSINRENLIFIYLDVHTPLNRDLVGPLRVIHDNVHAYSNDMKCLHFLRYSNDRVFFITTSNNRDLIRDAHDCPAVEAVFLWNSDVQIDFVRHPKCIGHYAHSEELLASIRNAFEWFEQTQLAFILFEHDQSFLWCQLWREYFKPTNPRTASTKEKLIDVAEKFYRGNNKLLKSLDDFDYCYERNDALQWCFVSPFPSAFLREAVTTRDMKRMDLCRFLINDVSRLIHQPLDYKASREFYRGLKVDDAGLEKLSKHTGRLICSRGYFTCFKSRKTALDLANSSIYRADLRPVLFKINCPPSVALGEIPTKSTAGLVVFDLYMTFRIKSVNSGPITVVTLEAASEDGKQFARAYRMKDRSTNLYTALDNLIVVLKPAPPYEKAPREQATKVYPPTLSSEEVRAQKLIDAGKLENGLAIYENMKSPTPRSLNTMAQIYAERKGDYNKAVKYYKQALKMQEKNGEDPTATLTQLGITHHNRGEYELALECHNRVLELQKHKKTEDRAAMASALIGVANAKWGQDDVSQALDNAEKALVLNESIESGNDINLAMNLAVLANIHHKEKNETKALEYSNRALAVLERCASADSLSIASVLNNMGAIQMALGLFTEAQRSLKRALEICEKSLPYGHPRRVTMERNIQRNEEIIRQHRNNPGAPS